MHDRLNGVATCRRARRDYSARPPAIGAFGAKRCVMNRWPFGSSFGIKSFLGVFVGVIVALMALTGPVGRAHEQVVRWDIFNVVAGNVTSGGIASAKATNADGMKTSIITLTASGTFEPPENDEEEDDVTGSGTRMI